MAKRSKEELLASANNLLGELTTDEVITFLEDIADSFDVEEVEIEGENWELKYREDIEKWEQDYKTNDEMWRKKYRDRFYKGEEDEEVEVEEVEETEEYTTTLEELLGL